jgi:TonB family protein
MRGPINIRLAHKRDILILCVASILLAGTVVAQTNNEVEKVYRVGDGVTPPVPIHSPGPQYSKQARHAKLEGVCILWLVVGADGLPRDIRVKRTLGLGLDEKAIDAVKKWRFKPAVKDGNPVAVEVSVQVNFHLY